MQLFDENGEKVTSDLSKFVCASKEDRERDGPAYKILVGRNSIFHPKRSDNREKAHLNFWKMRRVSKEIFELYLNFLKTRQELYYTLAERKFTEKRPGGLHGSY